MVCVKCILIWSLWKFCHVCTQFGVETLFFLFEQAHLAIAGNAMDELEADTTIEPILGPDEGLQQPAVLFDNLKVFESMVKNWWWWILIHLTSRICFGKLTLTIGNPLKTIGKYILILRSIISGTSLALRTLVSCTASVGWHCCYCLRLRSGGVSCTLTCWYWYIA